MAEISLWTAIKTCVIILLLIVVFKKLLKVWRQHKKEMKLMDDEAYAKRVHQEKLMNEQSRRENFAAATAPISNFAQAAVAPPTYGNPMMYGGDEEDVDEFGGDTGSFFDVLSKVKKPKKAPKKAPKKKKSGKK